MNQEPSYAKLLDTVREAGGDVETMTAFAALVAAAEREACEKVLEKMRSDTPMGVHVRRGALFQAIKAIRARGETK